MSHSCNHFNLFGPYRSSRYGIGLSKPSGIEEIVDDKLELTFDTLIESLDKLVKNYSLARFETLDELYKRDRDKIGNELLNTKSKVRHSETRRELRDFFKHTFEGIQQCVIQFSDLINTIEKLNESQKKSEILDDMDKLKEYLEAKKRNMRDIFGIEPITLMKAVVKPEYERYIQLYGFPEGSIFDTDKLTQIKKELA